MLDELNVDWTEKYLCHLEMPWVWHERVFPSGWYFKDETGDLHGPYDSKEGARSNLKRYCVECLGHKDEP